MRILVVPAPMMMSFPIFVRRLVQRTVSRAIFLIFMRLMVVSAVNLTAAVMSAVRKGYGSRSTEYQCQCQNRCGNFTRQFIFHA